MRRTETVRRTDGPRRGDERVIARFLEIVQARGGSLGWHWRGDARVEAATAQELERVPKPLRGLFARLHNQWLQWHTEPHDVYGAFVLLHASTFETSLGEVELTLGHRRRGRLFQWSDPLSFVDGEDEVTEVAIFRDDDDPDFCHPVVRALSSEWRPTAFGV